MGNPLIFVLLLTAISCGNARHQLVGYSSATVNEWTDRFLNNLKPQLIQHNVDPLKAPDMSLPFTFNFLFADHDGQLNLTDGWVVGVSTIGRHGDCLMNYDLKIIRLDLSLEVKELLLDFKYDLAALGFSPSGNLNAHITDQIINIGILIDVRDAVATLQHFELPNDGELKLSLDGLGLLGDALASVILAVVDNLFKDTVINKVSEQLQAIIENALNNFSPLPTIPPPLLQHLLV